MAANSIASNVLERIKSKKRGSIHRAKDFLELGSRGAIDLTLYRLEKANVLNRVTRGLYVYPEISKRLGPLSPSADAVASFIARKKMKSKLQVSGAQAANNLGLSTQVPAKPLYLTDGGARTFKTHGSTIRFRAARPRMLAGAGKVSGDVFQALRYLGRGRVNDTTVRSLRKRLSQADKGALLTDILPEAPDWMRPVLEQIAVR